ncbi:hypothetical protein T492DRAFT_979253 [Pavlovales sp. CCMP2436]|nr:hypothetical protein T492DRAFT_979253 [Pavlovales sp. CCMP2436]
MRQLRKRFSEVSSGDSSAATELYRLMTKEEPTSMIIDFLKSSSPLGIEAMQSTAISLLGTLPKQFTVDFSTSVERFAALVYQLQMTGYLFRNAEYVLMLRRVLNLQAMSEAELRAAFDGIDKDRSGFIDLSELKLFLGGLRGGAVRINGTLVSAGVSSGEVREFMDTFDRNQDSKVSWAEFKSVLGNPNMPAGPPSQKRLSPAPSCAEPSISGSLKIALEGGGELEVDAAKYIADLKLSIERMRQELGMAEAGPQRPKGGVSGSIGEYLSSLPKDELRALTANVQPDVTAAMKLLVDHVVKCTFETEELPPPRKGVQISRDQLAQVCMWQLILGYKLRQAEAKGEAQERLGV